MSSGYRIAGEPVSDAVGEEFGRLIAERDKLQQQVSAANLLAEQTVRYFEVLDTWRRVLQAAGTMGAQTHDDALHESESTLRQLAASAKEKA